MQKGEAPEKGFRPHFPHFATNAIHVGQEPEQWSSQAVVPPISLSTTFKQKAPGQHSESNAHHVPDSEERRGFPSLPFRPPEQRKVKRDRLTNGSI